jgi:hypothetical protein
MRTLLGTVALSALIILSACGPKHAADVASRAVEQFHHLLNNGEVDAIYDITTDRYQSKTARDRHNRYLRQVLETVGECNAWTAGKSAMITSTSGTFVSSTYQTKCAKGPLAEVFVIQVDGETGKIDRYNAQIPLQVD